MLAFTDVQYRENDATAACLVVDRWEAATPLDAWTVNVSPIAAYEPGAFFKRELPCLLAVLQRAPALDAVIIDGYVWLDTEGRPGLGAHLHQALGGAVPVIGLAKTAFRGSGMALPLERPGTRRQLFVTSIGMAPEQALSHLRLLHGEHRIPTLVRLVDQLARTAPGETPSG